MITVGNYPDLASARLAQSVLDAEGIFTNIPDEHLAGLDWQMGTALHGIRLQVPPEDAEKSTAILAELRTAAALEDDQPDLPVASPDGQLCPACGSDSLGPPKWKNRVKAAGLFFPPLLLAWPLFALFGPDAHCSSCGRGVKHTRPAV